MICKNTSNIMKAIRMQMLEEEISLRSLASKLDITPGTLSATMNRSNASFNTICKICEGLGYDLDIHLIKKI